MSEDIVVEDEPETEGEDEIEVVEEQPETDDTPLVDYSHEEQHDDDEPEPAAEVKAPDALAELQAQLEQLRGENEQLGRDRDASNLTSQQTIVATGLSQARADLAAAETELERASAAGDHKKVAAAHKALALAAVDVREFEAAADEVKAQVKAFRDAPAKPRQQAGDPFEVAIASMSDASKEWCRANKADLQKSPGRGNLAKAAHIDAIERGIKPDSPEYFDHLNTRMGYEAEPMPKTTKTTTKPTGKPRVAAPGGARAAPVNGGRAEVTLSKSEVEIAKSMGMSTKVYALRKKELIENGNDSSRSGPRYSQHSAGNRR